MLVGSLWINDGAIVLQDGTLCLNDDCPCTGTATYYYCDFCTDDEMPAELEIVIPSVGGYGCSDYAGTWVVPRNGECSWGETWSSLNGNPLSFPGNGPSVQINASFLVLVIDTGQGGWSQSITTPFDCKNMNETHDATAFGATCAWGNVTVRAR